MDITEQIIFERLADSVDKLANIIYEKKSRSENDIAEIFEDKYKQDVVLRSLISLLEEKEIINKKELNEHIKELRENIKNS